MSLNKGSVNNTIISYCPFRCGKNGCIGQCEEKDILREEIQKKNLLSNLDNQIIKKLKKINDPLYIRSYSDEVDILNGLKGKDYINQIGKEKSKLVNLLFGINLDGINGDKLKNLGTQIKQIGGNILLYELLAEGNNLFIEEPYEVENSKYTEPVNEYNEDLDIPSLGEINRDLKKQVELASVILGSLVKGLDKLSGEDISKSGDRILEVGYELQKLEIIKKSLEIKGGLV